MTAPISTLESPLMKIPFVPVETAVQQTPEDASPLPVASFGLIVAEPARTSATIATLPKPKSIDSEVLQHTVEKLQTLATTLKDAPNALSTNAPAALFDVYSLLRLLAEVAQEQRDSARQMRKAASSQSKLAAQEQIDLQRSAAYTGLAMGLTACAISVSMQVTNLTLSTTAKIKQEQIGQQMGLPEAQNAYAQEVALECKDAKVLAKDATNAQKALVKAVGENDAHAFQESLEQAPNIANARAEVVRTQHALTAAQDEVLLHPQSNVAREGLAHAITDHREAVGRYQTALSEQTSQYEILAQTHPDDIGAQARAQAAKVYQRQEMAPLFTGTSTTPDTPATRHFNLINAAVQNDPTNKRWASIASVSQSMTQITGSIGQTLNVTAQQLGQLQGAKASEASAKASKSRAAADAAAAIFTQEAEILTSVLEMMRSILESESRSMELILRA